MAEGSLEGMKPILPALLNLEQVIFVVISSFLLTKYGRKDIIQFGAVGAGIANIVMALGFWLNQEHPTLALVLLLGALFYYMASFNLSLGPIVWLYIPEIVEPSFVPYSTMVNWGSSALSILLFPIIKSGLPNGNPAPMFVFFALWSGLSYLINQRYVVETKDRTSGQIHEDYRRLCEK